MASTPESKVKRKVNAILSALDCYFFYPMTGGYGRSGVPDIIGCYKGLFFGIECKAGKGKATALQCANIDEINRTEGHAFVVREDTATLEFIREELDHGLANVRAVGRQ
jgi:Holliday junction resolvase